MKAIVLCAGYGTRLGDLTREIPKPMLDVNGRPLVAYILSNLRKHGFDEVAINLHFKPEMIRDYFRDGAESGLQITYSFESQLLGTAGAVKNLETYFRNEDAFLVHYGDVVTDQDLTALLKCHRERNALATVLLHQRANSNSIVTLDSENRIVGFLERPDENTRRGIESPWVNSGICICSPEILEAIPFGKSCDFPRDIFPRVLGTGRLFGVPLTGYRCAVDSPERLTQLRTALASGACKIVVL